MADHATNDLKYGHFGQVLYNSEEQSWLYTRNLRINAPLQPLGPSQVVVKSRYSNSLYHDRDAARERPGVRLGRQIASLINLQPSLAPAAEFIHRPAVVSQEIENAVVRHDPTFGQLLAFGRVSDEATKRSLSIAAFPASNHPQLLRFVQVQPQKHGWNHDKSVWIDVPRIQGESGSWDARAPIRQVCFADATEDSAISHFLAVRTTLGVSILRPIARKALASSTLSGNAPSRFDTTLLCAITLDVCGGIPPAHVSFNRWFPKQFATVDQQGTWRVWDTSIKQLPADHGRPVELCRGATNDRAVPDGIANASLLDDGWGSVTWAGNLHTLVAVSRKSLGIFDVKGKPVRLQSPNLGITGTPHWILDVLTSPSDPSFVFVLTSVALFCLRMRCLDEYDPDSYDTAGAEVVLQCRHFRDPEDIGLCLSSYLDNEDLVILIKSSLSPIATAYRFSSDETSATPFLTVSDPTLMTLPEMSSIASAASATLALDLQPVEFGTSSHHGHPSGPGKTYRDMSLRFFIVTIIASDLGIVQKLYYTSPTPQTSHDSLPEILPPDWRGRLLQSGPRLAEPNFVEASVKQRGDLGIDEEDFDDTQSNSLHAMRPTRDNWAMIYARSHTQTASAASQSEDFSLILRNIKEIHETTQEAMKGHTLLSEFSQQQILVSDIDEATAEFNVLIQSAQPSQDDVRANQSMSLLTRIADGAVLGIHQSRGVDPTTIYDNILAHWLTPLSQAVPGRIRLVKEQLARRIAADVCLACHSLRLPPAESFEDETQPVDAQDIQGAQPVTSFMPFDPQSSLPTPSPTATPSLTTATSLSSHPSTLVSPEFARLQRYTSFSPEKSTPAPLPKSLASSLAHWTLGGDPDEYDWLVVQREQERKAEEEDEDLTPRERARLKRRAEKFILKQRRETQKASMDLANSQAPAQIYSASQPISATPSRPTIGEALSTHAATQGTPLLASSQSQAPQNLFASQVAPGRFGGKPVKKKRKVGF